MEEIRKKVKTGAVNVVLTNENDEEIGKFSFNPNDLNIIKRYEEVVKKLDSIELSEDAKEDEIFELTDEIEKQIDYLLNAKTAKGIFAECNPLTLTESGDFFVEIILEQIGDIVEQVTDKRIKKKQAKIKKATSKYHK